MSERFIRNACTTFYELGATLVKSVTWRMSLEDELGCPSLCQCVLQKEMAVFKVCLSYYDLFKSFLSTGLLEN